MFKSKLLFSTIAFAFIMLGAAMTSNAQATRTWVSGVGDDVNPCSRTAPCKTFAGAISKTATNGEISCLDPGGFGAVTITKSITIDCEDTQGSILAAGTTGIIVNITLAADTKKAVKIRGISINGAATGTIGVRVLAANFVDLDEVVIDGFTSHGVSVETTSGAPKVFVGRSLIRSSTGNGINFFATGGTPTLHVTNTRILGMTGNGINLAGVSGASVMDSTISGNSVGVNSASNISLMNCLISGNTTGVAALTGGIVRIYGNMITQNTTGLSISGGQIVSSGNNGNNPTSGGVSSTVPVN